MAIIQILLHYKYHSAEKKRWTNKLSDKLVPRREAVYLHTLPWHTAGFKSAKYPFKWMLYLEYFYHFTSTFRAETTPLSCDVITPYQGLSRAIA